MPVEPAGHIQVAPPVEAFIVNYAGGEKLVSCVESLLASDYPSLRVRVIENNSRDDAIPLLREKHPGVDIIELEENVGYAGAMHVAAEKCESGLLIICNNDLVFEPDCVSKMVKTHLSSGASAVSARIVNPDETELERTTNASLNPLYFLVGGVFTDRTKAVYPSGACFLIIKDELAACLPPREMFLYYEDVFVGMALRSRGREIVQANDAAVHHHHGYSVASVSPFMLTFYRERNRHTCMFTFFGMWTLTRLALVGPIIAMARLLAPTGRRKSVLGAFTAWAHSSFSLFYIARLKRSIKGRNKSGEEIAKEYFTSRLVPDDHPRADVLNKRGRRIFGMLGIHTRD